MDGLEGLLQADFRETLEVVAGRADLIVTSPPYEDARTYGAEVAWRFEDYQRLGDAVAAALRPDGGQCLMVLGGPVRDFRGDGWTERSLMPYRVLLDWHDRLGLVTPDVYVYVRDGQVGRFKGRQRNNWEPLLWFATPGERTFDALRKRALEPGKKRRKIRGRSADGGVSAEPGYRTIGSECDAGNVLAYGKVGRGNGGPTENEGHPARFPYALAADIVACFSNHGDLVVDPFLGSGTSMIAALDGGRRFFGGDLLCRTSDGKPWVDVARDLARDRYAQLGLFADEKKSGRLEKSC